MRLLVLLVSQEAEEDNMAFRGLIPMLTGKSKPQSGGAMSSMPTLMGGVRALGRKLYHKKTGKNGNGATVGSSAAYSEDSPYYQR